MQAMEPSRPRSLNPNGTEALETRGERVKILGTMSADAEAAECMHGNREEEAGAATESRGRQETMPTYASCVLQTFHRLCKTSESVRPLELWEGGEGGGTGELTGQLSRLQQFTSTRGSNPTLPGGGGASVGPSVWSQLICSRCLDPNELFLHGLEVIWLWFGEPALNPFNLGLCSVPPGVSNDQSQGSKPVTF